jgi:hypothetical protein
MVVRWGNKDYWWQEIREVGDRLKMFLSNFLFSKLNNLYENMCIQVNVSCYMTQNWHVSERVEHLEWSEGYQEDNKTISNSNTCIS